MASSPMEMPAGGDQDRGPMAVVVYWIQVAIAILVILMRFYTRISIRALGADDWLMLATLIIFIAISSLVTYEAAMGGFRHLYYVRPQNLSTVGKINYIMQTLGIFSYITGKASVGCLILRIMGPRSVWRKWIIWIVIGLTFVVNSLNCIFTFVQCDPPRALWEPQILAKCWDPKVQRNFAYFVSSENILADMVLAMLPITFLYKLQLSLRTRVNLCILLGLGLLAAICGIVKTTFLGSLGAHSDLTWATYNLVVWSGAETFVIIVCGSVPPLKPLWDRYIVLKWPPTSGAYQHGSGPDQNAVERVCAKNQSSSVSSKTNALASETCRYEDPGIYAVTDIEVMSTQEDMPWKHVPFAVDECRV